jgi:transketolase
MTKPLPNWRLKMPEYISRNASLWSKIGANGVLGLAALELAAMHEEVFFLSADLGVFSGLSRFAAQYPERYLNVGIAEQNMLDLAAGLAAEGKTPFAVTYATFASMRAADQVRVCMAAMQLPIRLIGVGAGFATGILGATHMGLEDLAVTRILPGITVFSPADGFETMKTLLACADLPGPVYIRLTGELNNPPVYTEDYDFQPGKAVRLREGRDVAFIATGTMVHACLEAATLLDAQSCSAAVLDMHTIKPLDAEAVLSCRNAKLIVTAEEHSLAGGLGGAVAECLAKTGSYPPLLRLGLNPADGYPHADTYANLLERLGLTPEGICQSVMKALHG